MTTPFISCLDLPAAGVIPSGLKLTFRGWIASNNAKTLVTPVLSVGDVELLPLTVINRPDVSRAYPNHKLLCFHQEVSWSDLPVDGVFYVKFKIDGETARLQVSMPKRPLSFLDAGLSLLKGTATQLMGGSIQATEFRDKKERKLKRIENILACPECKSEDIRKDPVFKCARCNTSFNCSNSSFNFLSDDLLKYASVESTKNVSSNNYDPVALKIIDTHSKGLVLDCGCGLRKEYYDNVVNFEIVDYPSTDVLGIGEKLPFKSNSFDAAFSLAVLEHVRLPFECARELARVLKPGGVLYVVVPFLQPFHGYPNHYYNMTSAGLKNLFSGHLEIEECGVPLSGVPIWCLTWFLSSYLAGLPSPVADRFKQMKVADLIGDPLSYLQKDIVQQLSREATEELACTNYVIARKPK
jgi:SAM-dependent methyltransferase